MLVWLGKQYLGQSDRLDHSVSAEHKVISITPNVLERLHTSYRRTMEQLRTRGALPAATEEAPPGVAHPTFYVMGGGSKTRTPSLEILKIRRVKSERDAATKVARVRLANPA